MRRGWRSRAEPSPAGELVDGAAEVEVDEVRTARGDQGGAPAQFVGAAARELDAEQRSSGARWMRANSARRRRWRLRTTAISLIVTVAPKAWQRRRYGRLPPLVMGAITSAGPDSTEMTDIGGRMISGGRVAELELSDYTNGHSDEEY